MDWNQVAADFSQEIGRQVVLCAYCVSREGDLTPPPQIVIWGGFGYCLEHLSKVIT
jgi:hypothetical protein